MNNIGIGIAAEEAERNTVVFHAGTPSTEMLKVAPDGFWVRGVKVEQDEQEAKRVYEAFKGWMLWAELNKR